MKSSEFYQISFRASTKHRRAPQPCTVLYMLLLAGQMWESGEHAYDSLIVSLSMSISI
jgi:hypothetical protein